jgi:hypothetical protein
VRTKLTKLTKCWCETGGIVKSRSGAKKKVRDKRDKRDKPPESSQSERSIYGDADG